MHTQYTPALDDAFGHWLAGFVDGEGCFAVHRNHEHGFTLRFTIVLRDDDRAILEEIQHRLGTGRIHRRTIPVHKQASLNVDSKTGCLRIVEVFDRYPLRAKKRRDYLIWREAVLEWARMPRTYRGRRREPNRDWRRIEELRQILIQGRRYQAPPIALPPIPTDQQLFLLEGS